MLTGRVAPVTGGGIGKATLGACAAEGCDVMLVARTREDMPRAAAEIAAASGRRIFHHAADFRSAARSAAVAAHHLAFGRD